MASPSSTPSPVTTATTAETSGEIADATWRDRIHHFHLCREKTPAASDGNVWPAAIAACINKHWRAHESVLYLATNATEAEAIRPLQLLLEDTIQQAKQAFPIIETHLPRLTKAITEAAKENHAPDNFPTAVAAAWESLPEVFRLSPEAKNSLQSELADLRELLPESGTLIPAGAAGLLPLFSSQVVAVRTEKQAEFRAQACKAANRLAGILRLTSSRNGGKSSDDEKNTGSAFINQAALAGVRVNQPGATSLTADREKRISETIKILRTCAEDTSSQVTVVTPLAADAAELAWSQTTVVQTTDWQTEAIAQFQKHARQTVAIVRALQVAELELASAYDASIHDARLARLEWRGLSADALGQIPPVVVYLNATALTDSMSAGFLRLLRSGLPIQILIADDRPVPGVDATEIANFLLPLDLGSIAMAYNETFVMQASPTCPEQLLAGLSKMAAALRPGVAIVAAANESADTSRECCPGWVRRAAAVESRAQVCFQLDPAAGANDADRFSVLGNPQTAAAWPKYQFSAATAKPSTSSPTDAPTNAENESALDTFLTYAHAAALDPACAEHFWLIPEAAWDDEQVEISAYLRMFTSVPPERVPYLWAVNAAGELQRAIITRELAFACWERAQAWHNLCERAGINNEHVHRAVAATRAEVEAAAQADLSAALSEAQARGADAAIEKIVAALANPDAFIAATPVGDSASAASATGVAQPSASAEGETTTPTAIQPEAAESTEDSDEAEDPYIDSFLCTSCNECVNLNPRLFVYNSEKQAEIGDASAGTYAELVKAAEACPAKCIHPGTAPA